MGHAHHFLSRLDRVSLPHVELALSLYQDAPMLKYILQSVPLPDGAARVAISLADPQRGPFLVVTREGHFVTCLGEGMSPGEHPVIPREKLDVLATKVTVLRAKLEEARRVAGPLGGVGKLLRRVHEAGDDLSREEIAAVIALQPLYAAEFLLFYAAAGMDLMQAREILLQPLKRTDKLKPPYHSALRSYWNTFWSLGHFAVLSALDGPALVDRLPAAMVESLGHLSLSCAAVHHGVSTLALKATWGVGRIGKPLLAPVKQHYRRAHSALSIIDSGMSLSAIGLRHERLFAEVTKALSSGPEIARDGSMGKLVHAINDLLRAIVAPEKLSPANMTAAHRFVGAKIWMKATARLPRGAPYRFERVEDVPAEVALPAAVNIAFDFFNARELLQALFLTLPWVARAAPEQLYLTRDMIAAIHEPWTPERTTTLLRDQRAHFRRAEPKPAGPARKGPCTCGSGKKYKRCCGAESEAREGGGSEA